MRLPMNPSQTPATTPIFLICLATRGGREHVLGGLRAAHDFQELGDVRGAEEMQTDDILRPVRDGSDLVQIQRRGIGGEDGAHLRLAIERLEHLLLHCHVLEHRLDDEIGVRDVVVGERARDQREPLVELPGCQPALLERALVILLDDPEPLSSAAWAVSSTVTGTPALAKFMAMPPPMVPAPITATDRTGRVGVLEGTSGILAAARVAKKTCRNALDSVLFSSSTNAGRLDLHALLERLEHRRLDRIDAFARRGIILGERRDGAAREIEERLGVGEHDRDVARFLQGQLSARRIS